MIAVSFHISCQPSQCDEDEIHGWQDRPGRPHLCRGQWEAEVRNICKVRTLGGWGETSSCDRCLDTAILWRDSWLFWANYQGCLMVKLADQAAIDFVIADCSGVGVASRRLYLIQVWTMTSVGTESTVLLINTLTNYTWHHSSAVPQNLIYNSGTTFMFHKLIQLFLLLKVTKLKIFILYNWNIKIMPPGNSTWLFHKSRPLMCCKCHSHLISTIINITETAGS